MNVKYVNTVKSIRRLSSPNLFMVNKNICNIANIFAKKVKEGV